MIAGEDLKQFLLDRDAVLSEDAYPSKFSLQILDALNETMFEEQGFRGNSANYYNPANSYIDQVRTHREKLSRLCKVIPKF